MKIIRNTSLIPTHFAMRFRSSQEEEVGGLEGILYIFGLQRGAISASKSSPKKPSGKGYKRKDVGGEVMPWDKGWKERMVEERKQEGGERQRIQREESERKREDDKERREMEEGGGGL